MVLVAVSMYHARLLHVSYRFRLLQRPLNPLLLAQYTAQMVDPSGGGGGGVSIYMGGGVYI